MVAHRGLCGLEPENSIPAFVAAGNRSYYGVESDVHVTADGKLLPEQELYCLVLEWNDKVRMFLLWGVDFITTDILE